MLISVEAFVLYKTQRLQALKPSKKCTISDLREVSVKQSHALVPLDVRFLTL